jgi:hypothetical protein
LMAVGCAGADGAGAECDSCGAGGGDSNTGMNFNTLNLKAMVDGVEVVESAGYGIVRAVDEAKGVIYLATPAEGEVLDKLDAIWRGRVEVPTSLLPPVRTMARVAD